MQFNYRLAHAANIWAANNICGESQDILVELGSHVLQGYYCKAYNKHVLRWSSTLVINKLKSNKKEQQILEGTTPCHHSSHTKTQL